MTEGYFLIIPTAVIDDPNITDAEALLYGRINSLTRRDGYATASNGYLAKQLTPKKDEATISRMISKLKKCGYLKTFVDKASGNKRKIWTLETMANMDLPKQKKVTDEQTEEPVQVDETEQDLAGQMLDYFNKAFGNNFPSTSKGMLSSLVLHGVDLQSFIDTVNWVVTTWPANKRSNFKPSTLGNVKKFDDWNDTAVAKGFGNSKPIGNQQQEKQQAQDDRKQAVKLQNDRLAQFEAIHNKFYERYQLVTKFVDMPDNANDKAWDALIAADDKAFNQLAAIVKEREQEE